MGTIIRPEISENNPYYISKHRYYELKHFCLQYNEWVQLADSYDSFRISRLRTDGCSSSYLQDSAVEQCILERDKYLARMTIIKSAADETSKDLNYYILKGVTEGLSYEKLNARYRVPCCKDTYYILYRKFFWILDRIRN